MPLFFYSFAFLLIGSALGATWSRNPVISVLWLIFAFCNGAGLILLLGAEFLAMLLIVVYVGAVAVLFLFVIMMLDIRLSIIEGEIKRNLSPALLLSGVMLCDAVLLVLSASRTLEIEQHNIQFPILRDLSNTEMLGRLLYTDFVLPFETCGLILLVAVIGSIMLTFYPKSNDYVKIKDSKEQKSHNKSNCLRIAKPEINRGIDGIKYD
jgi:NADH-quinone oxidoreductase subunit J